MYSLYSYILYCTYNSLRIASQNLRRTPLSTPREMQTNMKPLDDQFIGNKPMNHEHPAFRLPSLTLESP